jgi:hypothetical protein
MDRHDTPDGNRRVRQVVGRVIVEDRDGEPEAHGVARLPWSKVPKYKDWGRNASRTQVRGLRDHGGCECGSAVMEDGPCDANGTVAVRIRLQHRHDRGRRNVFSQGDHVSGDGIEVDLKPRWSIAAGMRNPSRATILPNEEVRRRFRIIKQAGSYRLKARARVPLDQNRPETQIAERGLGCPRIG